MSIYSSNDKSKERSYFLVVLICIIGASFFLYSSRFYSLLTSDDGISILMIHYFDWKTSLYYWGQDRYGSLIPFLGHILTLLFHPSAIVAESLIHYLVLAAGFFAVSSFFRSIFLKIILCIIWFFPPFHMIDFLRNTLGVEFSVLGIALYFLLSSINNYFSHTRKAVLHYVIALFFFLLAVWVSDLDLASIGLVFLLILWYRYKESRYKIWNMLASIRTSYYISTGIAIGIGMICIGFLKGISVRMEGYQHLNSFGSFFESVEILAGSLGSLFLFRASEPLTGIYFYGVVILILILLFRFRFASMSEGRKRIISFFIIQSAVILFVVLVSEWVFISGVSRRYFVSIYMSFWIALLLIIDEMVVDHSAYHRPIAVLAITIAMLGGVGAIYNLNFIWPKSLTPAYVRLSEFKEFGNVGIIANYWNSYLIASTDPDHIIATPHQRSLIRNRNLVSEVFKQKRILVIRDGWFEIFPDTLFQYNEVLIKKGHEQIIGACFTCEYYVKKP